MLLRQGRSFTKRCTAALRRGDALWRRRPSVPMLLLRGRAETGTTAALYRCIMGLSNAHAGGMRRNSAVLLRIGRVFEQDTVVLERTADICNQPRSTFVLQISSRAV